MEKYITTKITNEIEIEDVAYELRKSLHIADNYLYEITNNILHYDECLNIDTVLDFLNESKANGATHFTMMETAYGVKLNAMGIRLSTDSEIEEHTRNEELRIRRNMEKEILDLKQKLKALENEYNSKG